MRNPSVLLATLVSSVVLAGELPDSDTLERQGAIIGNIAFERSNVFDLSNPEENNWFYRLANRLHIVTKENVVRKQLLFGSGDSYSSQRIDESERILRQNIYLFDAEVTPVQFQDGKVDLTVKTKDVWTLSPDLSVSRSGGENRSKYGIEETNLFGSGQLLRFARVDNVDRTSDSFEFSDRHLGRSWVSTQLTIADNSDGERRFFRAVRPFYALDTRWSAGVTALTDERRTALYALGEEVAEFRHERDYQVGFGGWSAGLKGKWTRRWTAGVVRDENRFSEVDNPLLPAAIPADRKLIYPFISLEIIEDEFTTTRNRDQIGQTEDFNLGVRMSASVGWSDKSFGADRNALIFRAQANRGFGSLDRDAFLVSAGTSGRFESGEAVNSLFSISARYYRTRSAKRLFFATLSASSGHALDVDNPVQLGGDSGLRGYPLRYQSGESRLLLTIEERYFTDWYPFRLLRIGGALFADVGRVWGRDSQGGRRFDWLTNIGLGLRFAPTRSSSGKMIHLDIAFPLGGDSSIDSVQVLLESKRSF